MKKIVDSPEVSADIQKSIGVFLHFLNGASQIILHSSITGLIVNSKCTKFSPLKTKRWTHIYTYDITTEEKTQMQIRIINEKRNYQHFLN